MYNTLYLPENFEQSMLEKTILRHFRFNLTCVPVDLSSFKMAEKKT